MEHEVDIGAHHAVPIETELQILATSDLHAKLRPFDYHAGRDSDFVGLAAALSLIETLRAAPGPSILVDNGDFLCGGVLGDRAILGEDGEENPVVAAMNAARYDAVALGNHEFDQGLVALERALAGRDWPVLSANIVRALGPDAARDRRFTAPWCIVERAVEGPGGAPVALRVGVIAVADLSPPELDALAGSVVLRDMVEAVGAHLPAIRDAGADIVLALCHTGLPGPGGAAGDRALELAQIPGIDAMVMGHRHMIFPDGAPSDEPLVDGVRGTVAGVPAVMPGFRGRQLGRIRLQLRHDGVGWSVTGSQAECVGVDAWMRRTRSRPAPAILALTDRAHRDWIAESDNAIGPLDQTLTTYFARLGRCRATQLVARAQRAAIAPLVAEAGLGHLPLIGVAAPVRSGGRGGARNFVDIPPGLLTRGDAIALYPYPNGIAALRLIGADLMAWLERSVSAFDRIAPGAAAQPLVGPAFPAFDFDMAEGVSFAVDLSQPARFDARGRLIDRGATRVSEVTHAGRALDPGQEIVLVTNSFRAFGGGNFPGAGRGNVVAASATGVQTAIGEFGRAGLPDLTRDHFRFRRVAGASAVLDTGPGALPHLADLDGLPVAIAGPGPEAFLRLRLDLDALDP